MGKKGLTSIFYKLKETPNPSPSQYFSPPWPWPSCGNPKTTSFRAGEVCSGPAACRANDIYKTINSVYFDSAESFFDDDDDEEDSFSTTESEESSEAVIRSVGRSSTDRLFFDPGPTTNSILTAPPPPTTATSPTKTKLDDGKPSEDQDEEKAAAALLIEESVALAVDSDDPYRDFRTSMEEMVAAHGLRDWAGLEELLVWYLRINGKNNHGFIVGAFVDLLVGLATTTTTTTTTTSANGATTTTTSASCSSTSCVTFEEEIHEEGS